MSGPDAGEEAGPVEFAAAPFDMVEDLCGDPDADLVVFLAGNQYMVVPDLVEGSGGAALRQSVEVDKAGSGEVVFTGIHHRQGPAWLAAGATDVAVVWTTEAHYHLRRAGPFEMVPIPDAQNRRGADAAAVVTGAAHQEAAGWFVDYLCGEAGQAVYAAHGLQRPRLMTEPAATEHGSGQSAWTVRDRVRLIWSRGRCHGGGKGPNDGPGYMVAVGPASRSHYG